MNRDDVLGGRGRWKTVVSDSGVVLSQLHDEFQFLDVYGVLMDFLHSCDHEGFVDHF